MKSQQLLPVFMMKLMVYTLLLKMMRRPTKTKRSCGREPQGAVPDEDTTTTHKEATPIEISGPSCFTANSTGSVSVPFRGFDTVK